MYHILRDRKSFINHKFFFSFHADTYQNYPVNLHKTIERSKKNKTMSNSSFRCNIKLESLQTYAPDVLNRERKSSQIIIRDWMAPCSSDTCTCGDRKKWIPGGVLAVWIIKRESDNLMCLPFSLKLPLYICNLRKN